MKSPKAPPAPDPAATAAAQSGMNRDTAQTQQITNMVDQVGPDGSIKYGRSGEESFVDSTGNRVTIPRYTQTTALSAPQQEIYNIGQDTERNIATIGRDQSSRIGELLGKPLNLNNEATEARLMDLGTKRLTPQFARDEEILRTSLANSGIRQGSAAWDTEMRGFGERKNDAYNQLMLSGRNQAVQEALTERNQPINEITALMSGSQVNMPTQNQTPQSQVAGVDYSGMVRDNHNAAMQQYQSKVGTNNAMMGGLFSLAGTVGSAAMKYSDRRLKSDVVRIGSLPSGLPVYEYTIFGKRDRGVMADEAAALFPRAVISSAFGLSRVDYGALA